MTMRAHFLTASLAFALFATVPACAQQQLIPAPYPSGNTSARILSAPPSSHHQMLIPSPYPRNLGPNALGNPRIGQVRRHQRLVPAPYPRRHR
jgi:hypothetical protein